MHTSKPYAFSFFITNEYSSITTWQRLVTPASPSWTSITSAAASSAYGNTQVFDFMKTQIGLNGSRGGGNLRPTVTTPNNWTGYTFNSINGTGQGVVTIDQDPPGTIGGTPEITVIITD